MTDSLDILRIIARDGGRLDSADRAAIAEAANEFEQMQRQLLATHAALIEANAQRIALAERLAECERPKPLSMSTGWVRIPLDGWCQP
jgi:SAM-dependent MidA family methyltransferase